jgi:iron complex outermembrane recepter protein
MLQAKVESQKPKIKESKIQMKRIKYFIPIMFFLLQGHLSLAQQHQSQIIGYVYNPDNEPAMYSTIMLLDIDSLLVKGAFSLEDGSFLLENIAPGSYFMMIRNIEFQTHLTPLITIGQNEKKVLDPILLSPAVNELGEVVVSADRALIEIHPDKMVYNVSASASATGNNGLELLGKAPGVLVDMDNNIILQGKSGVQIFINGRPTRLSGRDLANMLEGMRSDNIESIEIITNPSSRYDAEGTAGIINIVMKRNPNTGFNGNIVSSFSQGNFGRGSLGTTFNYNANKLSFNTNVSVTESDFQDDFVEVSERSGYILDMETLGLFSRRGYNISSGLDYVINAKSTISFDGRVFITERSSLVESNTGIIDILNVVPSEFLFAQTVDKTPSENYVLNLNYRYIPGRTSNISADISFGKYISSNGTEQPNTYFDQNNGFVRSVISLYDTKINIDLISVMLDYEKKFDFLTFTTGAKYSFVRTNNDLEFFNILDGNPVYDVTRSNDFSYEENVVAFYFMMNATPNQHLSLNAGVRLENTSSLGVLDSEIPTLDSQVPRNYNDFFPNIGISYNNQKNSVISASIGRRITRPNYQSLNPFESKMSELHSWKGNPFLQPNYITNYQLSYSYKRRLVISNTYSITRDFFANIFIIEGDKGSILTPHNMDKVTNNGLSVSLPLQAFQWWQFVTFLNYNHVSYNGDMGGTLIDLKANIYLARMQNMFKLPGGIGLELTYYAQSPWIWRGSITVKEYHGLNVGLRKDFMNRKLLLQLTGNDVFRTGSDFHYNSNYGGIKAEGIRTFDNQRFGFSLTYNFGNQQAKARQRSRSAIDDELRRLED